MNTARRLSPLPWETPTPTVQRDLFAPVAAGADTPGSPASSSALFAEVVFDRPLDHAFTYAVPEPLCEAVAVGKRVLAPLGKGDKGTVGYCVRLSDEAPPNLTVIKEIRRVLDDEALLTPDLLRLTRWMADYYLCGWGQVLNAVVPAGARQQAGTRSAAFLEAVPEAECPQPPPALTAKQQAALEKLRAAGRPVEPKRLAREVGCGAA